MVYSSHEHVKVINVIKSKNYHWFIVHMNRINTIQELNITTGLLSTRTCINAEHSSEVKQLQGGFNGHMTCLSDEQGSGVK